MRHQKARELTDKEGKPLGLWHWTTTLGDRVSRWGGCLALSCEGHPTAKDAELCNYEHELKTAHPVSFDSWGDCVECGDPAKAGARLGGAMGKTVLLCATHNSNAYIRAHTNPSSERWSS